MKLELYIQNKVSSRNDADSECHCFFAISFTFVSPQLDPFVFPLVKLPSFSFLLSTSVLLRCFFSFHFLHLSSFLRCEDSFFLPRRIFSLSFWLDLFNTRSSFSSRCRVLSPFFGCVCSPAASNLSLFFFEHRHSLPVPSNSFFVHRSVLLVVSFLLFPYS